MGHNNPMKTLPLILILLIFNACSTQREHIHHVEAPAQVESKEEVGAVWSLLSHDQLTLHLKNVDNGKNLSVILGRGISKHSVPEGHWEIAGFEQNGKTFLSLSTSKKFVFNMKPKVDVYAGSIILDCPTVTAVHFKHLKRMKFFNRYPFSSSHHLCELVVGNDIEGVRSEVKKLHKSKKLKLIQGL